MGVREQVMLDTFTHTYMPDLRGHETLDYTISNVLVKLGKQKVK